MKEMWDLVLPQTPDMLDGFSGQPETMTELKNLLLGPAPLTEAVGTDYRSWACLALDKALDPQGTKLALSPEGHMTHSGPHL